MMSIEELLMRRGVQVIAVQEINPPVTPFLDLIRQAKAQVHNAPRGWGNDKSMLAAQLELAEARGWVLVAADAHPKHCLEFAVIIAVIEAAEYTDSGYWMARFASIATTLLVDLIKKLREETK